MKRKLPALLLTACMMLTLLPAAALAEEPAPPVRNLSITKNGATTYFSTVKEAFAAAQPGDTITVLEDFEEPKDPALGDAADERPNPDPFQGIGGINPYIYVPEGKPITLDLGTHVLGGEGTVGFVGGNVLVRGETQGDSTGILVGVGSSGCDLTLKGCQTISASAKGGKVTVQDSQIMNLILFGAAANIESGAVQTVGVVLDEGLPPEGITLSGGSFTGMFADLEPEERPDDIPDFALYFSNELRSPSESPDQFPDAEAIERENQRRLEEVKAYAAAVLEKTNGQSGKKTLVHNGKLAEIKATIMKNCAYSVYIAYFDAPLTVSSKITLDANGGSGSPESVYTDGNGKLDLAKITSPSQGDYLFDGWYTRKTGGEKVTADTGFDRDATIYAHWKNADGSEIAPPVTPVTPANPTGPAEPEQPERPKWNPFTDVTAGDWFHDDVKAVYEKGLMVGTGETRFSPNQSVDRAMAVTVLWRLAGSPEPQGGLTFSDCAPGAYYAKAAAWAAERHIAAGFGGGNFRPDASITREQLASFLYRYAGEPDSQNGTNLDRFSDSGRISGYAREAMEWAVTESLLSGYAQDGKTYIQPQGIATRAETAAVFARFLRYTAK